MTHNAGTLKGFNCDLATAIIGVDTLWGGNVENRSGAGRVIADSNFSGFDLPPCYFDPTAVLLRSKSEGVLGTIVGNQDILRFLRDHNIMEAIASVRSHGTRMLGKKNIGQWRGKGLVHLADALDVMLQLALAQCELHDPVPYERAVIAATGQSPRLYDVSAQREAITKLLNQSGTRARNDGSLCQAVDAWRMQYGLNSPIGAVSQGLVKALDDLTVANVLSYLPSAWHTVPRTNVRFKLIESARFSGSLTYLGRKRRFSGAPEYEAIYEINAALEISFPEFWYLIAHEVVPGHIMNYALLHYLFFTKTPGFGFETTIRTMNTPGGTMAEGLANIAPLLALGVQSVGEVENLNQRLGIMLMWLQDLAKANISYRLHVDGMRPNEVEQIARRECLLSRERAHKLTHAWGKHPLLGCTGMLAYAVGTQTVGELLRTHGPAKVIPALYGVHGPADIITLPEIIAQL